MAGKLTEHRICHCDLSGEMYVVSKSTCCEVCTDFEKQPPFTPENVNKVFTAKIQELGRLRTILGNQLDDGK